VHDLRCNLGCITVEHLESSPSLYKNMTLEKTCITPLKLFYSVMNLYVPVLKVLNLLDKVMKLKISG